MTAAAIGAIGVAGPVLVACGGAAGGAVGAGPVGAGAVYGIGAFGSDVGVFSSAEALPPHPLATTVRGRTTRQRKALSRTCMKAASDNSGALSTLPSAVEGKSAAPGQPAPRAPSP